MGGWWRRVVSAPPPPQGLLQRDAVDGVRAEGIAVVAVVVAAVQEETGAWPL